MSTIQFDKELQRLIKKAEWALDEEQCDSNDAEHDALWELVGYLKELFIRELESRSMSTWSDEELKRYSILTGQEESEQWPG